MSELKKLTVALLLSLLGGGILTRVFPFLFGSQIYDNHEWQLLAPSSLWLSRATTVERSVSLGIDTIAFGAIIFAAWQGLRWAIRYR